MCLKCFACSFLIHVISHPVYYISSYLQSLNNNNPESCALLFYKTWLIISLVSNNIMCVLLGS